MLFISQQFFCNGTIKVCSKIIGNPAIFGDSPTSSYPIELKFCILKANHQILRIAKEKTKKYKNYFFMKFLLILSCSKIIGHVEKFTIKLYLIWWDEWKTKQINISFRRRRRDGGERGGTNGSANTSWALKQLVLIETTCALLVILNFVFLGIVSFTHC